MELNKDFREFIELLNAHEVQYLVIGGYAVNFHGYPRYTQDIDFWIWMAEANIRRLLTAMRAFGFGSLGLDVEDFKDPENVIQLGYAPYRIDMLVDVNGLEFETSYQRSTQAELDGVVVRFLSLPDLVIAKKNAGRLQDLADAEQLEKLARKKRN